MSGSRKPGAERPKRSADGVALAAIDLRELHEAALALMWANRTTTLRDAVDVLGDAEMQRVQD